jgi:hypothetical protein
MGPSDGFAPDAVIAWSAARASARQACLSVPGLFLPAWLAVRADYYPALIVPVWVRCGGCRHIGPRRCLRASR